MSARTCGCAKGVRLAVSRRKRRTNASRDLEDFDDEFNEYWDTGVGLAGHGGDMVPGGPAARGARREERVRERHVKVGEPPIIYSTKLSTKVQHTSFQIARSPSATISPVRVLGTWIGRGGRAAYVQRAHLHEHLRRPRRRDMQAEAKGVGGVRIA